jgi:hypothetical protein
MYTGSPPGIDAELLDECGNRIALASRTPPSAVLAFHLVSLSLVVTDGYNTFAYTFGGGIP